MNIGVIVNIGPEMSGTGKAMWAILNEADLVTIAPGSQPVVP